MKFLKILAIISVTFFLIFLSFKYWQDYKFAQALKDASQIPESTWEEKFKDIEIKNNYKVVLITVNGGELTYAKYFQYSAEKLGWQVKIFNKQTLGHENEILEFDPDFIIFACYASPEMDSRITAHRSKKYSLNFVPFELLRNKRLINSKNPFKASGNLAEMNKIVHGLFTVAKEIKIYEQMFKNIGKDFYGLRLFPLVPDFDNQPAEPKKLMWMGSSWDSYRSSDEYKNFITSLAKNFAFKAYGHLSSLKYLPRINYGGYISPGIENIKAIRENGIYLVTHSDHHFKGNVPSMRPFEAAAANAVIISDKLPFLVENFGGSFLYFDHDADNKIKFEQIRSHIEWIKNNPDKAKAKAAAAHKIFKEKFTLEKDLIRIAKMHEYILKTDEILWKLDYPIGF